MRPSARAHTLGLGRTCDATMSSRSEWSTVALVATAVPALAGALAYAYPEATAAMLERQAKRLRSRRRPVRVYMDGCFDLAHFGHANALRQAKACGDVLVVGLVPDREILRCKGPPVLEEAERRAVIESLRWVDELIEDVPYDINPEFMRELYDKHNIDYIVHGDDPCLLPDGTDAYDAPKRAGRFKMIKRTEGISTTNIVERCLHVSGDESIRDIRAEEPSSSITTTVASHFCTTARRVTQFSGGGRAPPPGARVVYAHGAFDLFHSGHVRFLERARALGDFLIVGVHEDAAVRARRGVRHPVLNAQERALGVMACRHADEVIIGAPGRVTRDLLATFHVAVVVAEDPWKVGGGEESEYARVRVGADGEATEEEGDGDDPDAAAKVTGVYAELPPATGPGAGLTTAAIIDRIAANRRAYEARNAKKNASEAKYYEQKSAGAIELAEES